MASVDFLKKVALSFAETQEAPHFEKTSFRIKNKIFATYLTDHLPQNTKE